MSCYLRVRGKVYGPYTEQQLQAMQTKGSISRTTEISDDGLIWFPASACEFLYAQPVKSPEPTEDVDASLLWFYRVDSDNTETKGPEPAANIGYMIIAGELNAYSQVWQEGESPRLLRSVPQFAECLPQRQSVGAIFYLAALLAVITLGVGVFAMLQKPLPTPSTSETQPPSNTPLTTEEIAERVDASIAHIDGQRSQGTGFLIRPNILATNQHVIDTEFLEQIEIQFPATDAALKGPYAPKLLYVDPHRDIAFLQVSTSLTPLSLAKDHTFKRGQEIVVIGNPGDLQNAISVGTLSTQKEIDGQQYYQLGIAINPGNSGGPVINRYGEVIGIATLKSSQEGIAFCIPSADILAALTTMEKMSDAERENASAKYRAQVAFKMLAVANKLYQLCMTEYDKAMRNAIDNGDSADDGINAVRSGVEKGSLITNAVFMDDVKKMLPQITSDSRLPKDFRDKLGEFYANCKEMQSYVDNPRGTVRNYIDKRIELGDTGDRLREQLRLSLGISKMNDEDE